LFKRSSRLRKGLLDDAILLKENHKAITVVVLPHRNPLFGELVKTLGRI